MATTSTEKEGKNSGRRTRKQLRIDLSKIPGSRLLLAIEIERERRKATYDQAAEQIGIGPQGANYLRRAQSGGILWSASNLERLRLVAKWLRLSAIEVMAMADVIGPEDFERYRQPEDVLDHLVEVMAADPRYALLLPSHTDLVSLPRWAKIALVASYQDASRRMLLPLARQLAE